MVDEVKLRSAPPQPLPSDEAFAPGRDPGPDAHPPEDEFWQNVVFEDNTYKIAHYRASAQALANELGCAVLLHYYAVPKFHNTGSTMMAALIPAEEGKVQPPPAARSKKSD